MVSAFRMVFFVLFFVSPAAFAQVHSHDPFVAILDVDTMILPGTGAYVRESITEASAEGAALIVIRLQTPGGMLDTTQEMVQAIFASPVPVVVYVTPSGAMAASAGVFLTLSAHVAAMSPGTSIGAAHPVQGNGTDIQGDMRTKAESITVAMLKSIAEQRKRNTAWAEKAVRESSSLTEREALEQHVIDIVADDLDALLKQLKGREIELGRTMVTLQDFSTMRREYFPISFKDHMINVLANPNVIALLWLAATTGLTLELYHPGAILPGVVGVVCLILALLVSNIIPVNLGAVLLLVVGAVLIATELYLPSGVLAVGGLISLLLGSLWLIDSTAAPGMQVNLYYIWPVVLLIAAGMIVVIRVGIKTFSKRAKTGFEGLVGQQARALETISGEGKVFVAGEVWNASLSQGIVQKDELVRVTGAKRGLTLVIEKVAVDEKGRRS